MIVIDLSSDWQIINEYRTWCRTYSVPDCTFTFLRWLRKNGFLNDTKKTDLTDKE